MFYSLKWYAVRTLTLEAGRQVKSGLESRNHTYKKL